MYIFSLFAKYDKLLFNCNNMEKEKIVLEGVLARVPMGTHSGRIYPSELIADEVKKLKDSIDGEILHNATQMSHSVTDLAIKTKKFRLPRKTKKALTKKYGSAAYLQVVRKYTLRFLVGKLLLASNEVHKLGEPKANYIPLKVS